MNLRNNLTTLSLEVIFALVGMALCAWYLTDYSINYEAANCKDIIENNDECKKVAIYITILSVMFAVSVGMLAWGVSC